MYKISILFDDVTSSNFKASITFFFVLIVLNGNNYHTLFVNSTSLISETDTVHRGNE